MRYSDFRVSHQIKERARAGSAGAQTNLKTVKGCAPPTSSELLNIIIQSGLDFNSIPRAPENDVD